MLVYHKYIWYSRLEKG